MSSPRLRRLAADYEQLRARFDGHPAVRVEALGTVPPEKYRITYNVPSLRLDDRNRPVVVHSTVIDLELPIDYPRAKPHAVAHGKVFHPNFGEYVCIADFWTPAQSLADIVSQMGQMLQWQTYNVQSPLNAVAADWVASRGNEVPVGGIDMYSQGPSLELKITPLEGAPRD